METDCWSVEIIITKAQEALLPAIEVGLEEVLAASALSNRRESEEAVFSEALIVEAFFETEPERAELDGVLERIESGLSEQAAIIYHASRDWLAENRADFPALAIGRFWIYGSHINEARPAASLPLLVDAALAFGSGTHPTTAGCLMALELVAMKQKPGYGTPTSRILDMGCGSAILAMAARRLYPSAYVMASDIDGPSVRTAAENRRLNHFAPAGFEALEATGFRHPIIKKRAPYQLIFANILAPPLKAMAGDLSRSLAPSGHAILSGLLSHQANAVIARYRTHGLMLVQKLEIDGWATLILKKPANGKAR